MVKPFVSLLLFTSVCSLIGCQQNTSSADKPVQEVVAAPAETGAPTEAAARKAVAVHLQQQSNASLYLLDSARVVDIDTHWQVMVPRTDWAKRMPNAAAFEVDKLTGHVTTLLVK